MTYAIVITSNDGGAGYVAASIDEVYRIIIEEFGGDEPAMNQIERDAMYRSLETLLNSPETGCWSIRGRSAWKETAYVGKLDQENT